MNVLIEELGTDEVGDGLTQDQLQTDVELRLRKALIKVVSPDVADVPYIYVNANLLRDGFSYVYSLSLSMRQWSTVEENAIQAFAETWSVESVGIVGRQRMARIIRDKVGDYVDKFINAYLSVNPKK